MTSEYKCNVIHCISDVCDVEKVIETITTYRQFAWNSGFLQMNKLRKTGMTFITALTINFGQNYNSIYHAQDLFDFSGDSSGTNSQFDNSELLKFNAFYDIKLGHVANSSFETNGSVTRMFAPEGSGIALYTGMSKLKPVVDTEPCKFAPRLKYNIFWTYMDRDSRKVSPLPSWFVEENVSCTEIQKSKRVVIPHPLGLHDQFLGQKLVYDLNSLQPHELVVKEHNTTEPKKTQHIQEQQHLNRDQNMNVHENDTLADTNNSDTTSPTVDAHICRYELFRNNFEIKSDNIDKFGHTNYMCYIQFIVDTIRSFDHYKESGNSDIVGGRRGLGQAQLLELNISYSGESRLGDTLEVIGALYDGERIIVDIYNKGRLIVSCDMSISKGQKHSIASKL